MSDQLWLRRRIDDLKVASIFLTRVPVTRQTPIARGELSRALWAAPIIGAAVGLIGAAAYALSAQALNLPPLAAATLAIAATIVLTGGLHEDGLADVADGFGGGVTRERKLEIMRDSRIGTYGVCALVLSLLLRVSALASIGDPALVAAALIGAHAAARAPLAALMWLVPPARAEGLSADAGRPPLASAIVGALLGLIPLVIGLGRIAGIIVVLLACGFGLMVVLCKRQIGGQTGDVLGALEQFGESVVLLVVAAAASSSR